MHPHPPIFLFSRTDDNGSPYTTAVGAGGRFVNRPYVAAVGLYETSRADNIRPYNLAPTR